MDSEKKTYKTNIPPKIFYAYITFIFLFVLIFSITFLITQFIEKQKIISEIINSYLADPNFDGDRKAAEAKAISVFKAWSLPTYFGGLTMILIFFVFVMFGRVRVEYGYFFRTLWLLIFMGSAVFIFFTIMPLWQQLVNFFILVGLIIVTLIDLLKVNRSREQLKLEIRNEWKNTRNNNNVKGGE